MLKPRKRKAARRRRVRRRERERPRAPRRWKIGVTDGPFPEAKELIGGYAILEYSDKEAALQGCAEFLEVHRQNWPGWEGEIEMRPIINKTTAPP